MGDPRLAVVIPSFNRREMALSAVTSVLTVRPGPFREVIAVLVDDGSSDGTFEAGHERFADRAMVLRIPNSERGAARNHGARQACEGRGATHLLFLDSDDLLIPETLERLYGPEAPLDAIVTGMYEIIDGQGRLTGRRAPACRDPARFKEVMYQGETVIKLNCTVLPAQVFAAIGGFCERREVSGREDWLFSLHLLHHGPIRARSEVVSYYRVYGGNTTARQFDLSLAPTLEEIALAAQRYGFSERLAGLERNWRRSRIGVHNSDLGQGEPWRAVKDYLARYPQGILEPAFWRLLASVAWRQARWRLQQKGFGRS